MPRYRPTAEDLDLIDDTKETVPPFEETFEDPPCECHLCTGPEDDYADFEEYYEDTHEAERVVYEDFFEEMPQAVDDYDDYGDF